MMDAGQLVFGIKDVVVIILGVISILGFLYALKSAISEVNKDIGNLNLRVVTMKSDYDEKLLHERNAKKAHKIELQAEIDKAKDDLKEKEQRIYDKIAESRQEHKEDHARLLAKVDAISFQMSTLNSNISELTGYLKGKHNN